MGRTAQVLQHKAEHTESHVSLPARPKTFVLGSRRQNRFSVTLLSVHNQKRPDVHKIVLSIKLRFPPPRKASILRIFYWFVQFSSCWALFWGGGEHNFADKNLWTSRLTVHNERKFSPKFFWPKFLGTPLESWTSAPSGHRWRPGTPRRGRDEKRQKMSWQIGLLPSNPILSEPPPPPRLPLMSSEVQKRGKLVREVRGSKDKTDANGHFLSRPLPGVPFWPSSRTHGRPRRNACLRPLEKAAPKVTLWAAFSFLS